MPSLSAVQGFSVREPTRRLPMLRAHFQIVYHRMRNRAVTICVNFSHKLVTVRGIRHNCPCRRPFTVHRQTIPWRRTPCKGSTATRRPTGAGPRSTTRGGDQKSGRCCDGRDASAPWGCGGSSKGPEALREAGRWGRCHARARRIAPMDDNAERKDRMRDSGPIFTSSRAVEGLQRLRLMALLGELVRDKGGRGRLATARQIQIRKVIPLHLP